MSILIWQIAALFLVGGCTGAVAPKNEGKNPGGSGSSVLKQENSGTDDTTGEGTTEGTTEGGTAEGGDEGGDDGSGEADPVGEALNVTGDFTDLNLKYIYATHRPSYTLSGSELPATLTFVFTEYLASSKKIKEYQCVDCDDSIAACFCAKDENKDDEKCKASANLEYDQFSVTFSAKNALVPLQSGEVHQVEDTGYPKKASYELKVVPTDFSDPNYAAFTSSNQLEGMSAYYTFFSTDASKIKSRTSVAGTLVFKAAPTDASKDFEFDLDITFKKNSLLGDNNDDQSLKGKFKGPISEYEEPVAYPTDCTLPEKYAKPVYE